MFNIVEVQLNRMSYPTLQHAFMDIYDQLEEAIDYAELEVPAMMQDALQQVADEMKKKHGTPWSGGPSGNNLQVRSGDGLRSIQESIQVRAQGGTEFAVGKISAAKLSFHEEGGTIRATRSQYLTIPLPAALDSRGVPLRERARAWDNTFVARSKKGNLLIFRKLPNANEVTPLYVLKPEITIRPRLKMTEAFNSRMTYFEKNTFEEISNIIDEWLP